MNFTFLQNRVRSISTVLILLFFLCNIALCNIARAQDAARATPNIVTVGRKKMANVDGRATPLLWADGISDIADLDSYAATGLNTVVVRLQWRASDDGAPLENDLVGARAFADAAAAKNLNIVYALPAAPTGMERAVRTAGDSEPYFLLWNNWVAGAFDRLRDTPNLLGWMLPDDPRALPYADDIALGRWARANFASIEVLNNQWKTGFGSFDELSISVIETTIRTWQGVPPDASSEEIEDRMRDNPPKTAQPWAWHPAALGLAQFRLEAYRALLGRWARIVKETDPLHFVMSGRTPDYAQLLALPPEIDVAVPDIAPGVAENDMATHNPQSIDIARRGGRFAAVAMLATAPARLPVEALPRAMQMWMRVALVHGASGIGFASWNDLKPNAALRAAISGVLRQAAPVEKELKTGATSTVEPNLASLRNAAPQATAAVLLTPLADGQTLQIGRDAITGAPSGEPRGLYGFGTDMIHGEPSNLVWALRWGTAFGSVDYLAPEDLQDVELDRYGALLMPQALSLDDAQVAAIGRFVFNGGAAVADLGVGAVQSGWQAMMLPPSVQSLFGVMSPQTFRNTHFSLTSLASHPAFPTFVANREGALLTSGDGPSGTAFSGPMTFAPNLPGTVPLALGRRLPQPVNGRIGLRWLDSTLSLKSQGEGFAIHAPFRLWNSWRPPHPGYAQFHGDLFARGAALVQYNAEAFVPAPGPEVDGGLAIYPQMINYPSEIALINHRPPQSDPEGEALAADWRYARIQTPGVGDFLWSRSLCFFPENGEVAADAPRRPSPAPANEFASRPRLVEINAAVRAQSLSLLELLPVSAQNLGGGNLAATVVSYLPQTIKLATWPNASALAPENGAFNVTLGASGNARITVYNRETGYPVAPNSSHRVLVTELNAPAKGKKPAPTTRLIAADANGVLRIEFSSAAALVEIAPN